MAFSKRIKENPEKVKMLWICYSRALDLHTDLAGSERIERSRHLSKEGNDTYLIAADFEKEYYQRNSNMHLISIPLRYFPVVSPILYGLVLFFFLPLYLVKIRPDFVISGPHTALFLIWKPVLSKLLKFKMILDLRGNLQMDVSPELTPSLRLRLQSVCFNISVYIAKIMFDGITVVTPMLRKEICQRLNISPKWVGILSNGISDEFLASDRQNRYRTVLRKKFGLSEKFVILYHGSLRRTGGLVESIKAIALVKKDYPNAVLFLLGRARPPVLRLLERTIKENDVQDSVVLYGPVDFLDVPRYISMCDLGIVPLPNTPDWRYQQPLKLLEYMAMEKTVIVSDIPAHRSIIGSNKNGIYVSHVNPVELAKAIRYAYDNRYKLDEWGKIGREMVMRKYTWRKVNEDLMDYLLKIQLDENRQK